MQESAADEGFTLGLQMMIAAGQLEAGTAADVDGFVKASFGPLAAIFRELGTEFMVDEVGQRVA